MVEQQTQDEAFVLSGRRALRDKDRLSGPSTKVPCLTCPGHHVVFDECRAHRESRFILVFLAEPGTIAIAMLATNYSLINSGKLLCTVIDQISLDRPKRGVNTPPFQRGCTLVWPGEVSGEHLWMAHQVDDDRSIIVKGVHRMKHVARVDVAPHHVVRSP